MPVAVLVLITASVTGVALRTLYSGPQGVGVPGSPPPGPPEAQPGSPLVQFSPGAAEHPDFGTVRSLLQIYFDSINLGRYDQWKTTVVTARQRERPEPVWRDEYATTRDGNIMVQRIEPGPDRSLRVLLTFTSVQDPADAPQQMRAPCVRWSAVYPLVNETGELLLDTNRFPGSTRVSSC